MCGVVRAELLNMIRKTEHEDLSGVMQLLVNSYVDEITPLAVSMASHLADTFARVIESDPDGSDEKRVTTRGIIDILETLLIAVKESKKVGLTHACLRA